MFMSLKLHKFKKNHKMITQPSFVELCYLLYTLFLILTYLKPTPLSDPLHLTVWPLNSLLYPLSYSIEFQQYYYTVSQVFKCSVFKQGVPVWHWAKLAIACLMGHMIAHCQHASRQGPREMKLSLALVRAPKQLFDPRLGIMVISLSIQLHSEIISYLIASLKFTYEFLCVIMIH